MRRAHDVPAELCQVIEFYIVGVVNESRHAPHVAGGIVAPRRRVVSILFVDAVAFEHISDIGGDVLRVIVAFDGGIKEILVVWLQIVLCGKFHDHVLGRAQKIVRVAELKLIIHVFIGAKSGIFHADGGAVLFFIPAFKAFDHGGGFFRSVPGIFPAFVNVLFPVKYAQDDRLIAAAAGCDQKRRKGYDRGECKCADAFFSHFPTSFLLRPARFAVITTMRMTTKMMVVSAQNEESVSAVCALPRMVALNT